MHSDLKPENLMLKLKKRKMTKKGKELSDLKKFK